MSPEKKVVVITGASSGIGRATALEFARRGYALAMAARRAERLEQVARECQEQARGKGVEPPDVLTIPTDVADESQVRAMVERTVARFGRVDVLVANAGYGLFARVDETPADEMRKIFDVNFMGVFHCCKAVWPIMRQRRGGHIFIVSSVIGKRGTPYHGAYCATKFALCGLADSMRVEMAACGVRVTTVCPALTDTEFFDKSISGQAARTSFAKFKSLTPPAKVAIKMARAVGKNKPEIVFTLGGKFLVLVSQLWPGLADRMMKMYYKELSREIESGES
jgi:short-subunit dehydrogenase